AAPPVIGYCAVTGDFDSGAAILLAIFSLWQMPHSYAIAIFRFKDYQAANIPVLPVVKGISVAKNHITLYIIAFAVATLMLTLGGYAGYKYLVVAAVVAAVSVWSPRRSAFGGSAWRYAVTKWKMIRSGRASCSASLSLRLPR
ncbi:Heme O synthase CtaB, partial [Salmonella enterica subsp. enterica serovar Senftenberg str. A4-543]